MKIKSIEIDGFRGIPKRLKLNFQPERSSTPLSVILYGDNGTGKSSIIDAIEFALQSRVGRAKSINESGSVSLLSLSSENDCCMVIAELSDGSFIERHINTYEDELYLSNYLPHPLFSVSPFVLRRTDVLRLQDTPEIQRQLVFFDFFKKPKDDWFESPMLMIDKLVKERANLKDQKHDIRENIADLLHWSVDEVPQGRGEILEFIKRQFYRGMSQKEWKQAIKSGRVCAIPAETEELINRFVQTTEKISSLNGQIKEFKKFKSGKISKPMVQEVLSLISSNVSRSFTILSNSKFIQDVLITHSDISNASLSVKLRLCNSIVCNPNQVLSEANLDLLSFLLYLEAMKASSDLGQAKIIVLDDVFQSVDSTIRLSVVDHILCDMKDWQIILSTHDRMWREQVKDLFRRHGRQFVDLEISRWEFISGPVFRDGVQDMEKILADALDRAMSFEICSSSGWVLEAICNRLSWTIPISMPRRKDDKYTLGDMWPPLFKFLKKTNLKMICSDVDKWMHLRNLVGSHFNSWAQSLSDQESQNFGESVLLLLKSVLCSRCKFWIESKNQGSDLFECRCGSTKILRDQ
jgi:AAA15 family ATPase/GTPase